MTGPCSCCAYAVPSRTHAVAAPEAVLATTTTRISSPTSQSIPLAPVTLRDLPLASSVTPMLVHWLAIVLPRVSLTAARQVLDVLSK